MVVFVKSIFKRDIVLATTTYYGLNLAAFIGFILFLCIYLFLFINLPIMKVIFIFPALVFTFPQFFLRAVEFIDTHLKNHFHWISDSFYCLDCDFNNSLCGGYYQHDPIALFPQNGLVESQPSCQHNIEPKEGKSAFMRSMDIKDVGLFFLGIIFKQEVIETL